MIRCLNLDYVPKIWRVFGIATPFNDNLLFQGTTLDGMKLIYAYSAATTPNKTLE